MQRKPLDHPVPAHAHDFLLLQYAQEIGLGLQADIADLSREDAPPSAISEFALCETAPGECALSWPNSSL
jgi:hypothetical protein